MMVLTDDHLPTICSQPLCLIPPNIDSREACRHNAREVQFSSHAFGVIGFLNDINLAQGNLSQRLRW